MIRRGVNVLKRIRHVLWEEISIRERLKVSVAIRAWTRGQDLDFISFHSDYNLPRGRYSRYERTQRFIIELNLKILSIKIGMSEPNNQSPFARLTRSSVHNSFRFYDSFHTSGSICCNVDMWNES